jgi:hypothetical protein
MHLISVHWTEEFESDLLSLLGTDTVRHPVKKLRKKHHEEPKDGPGAEAGGDTGAVGGGEAGTVTTGGDEFDSKDPDSGPQQKKGWWGRLESKLKQVLCF